MRVAQRKKKNCVASKGAETRTRKKTTPIKRPSASRTITRKDGKPPIDLYGSGEEFEDVFKDNDSEDDNDEFWPPDVNAIGSVADRLAITSPSKNELQKAIDEAMEPTTPKKKKEEIKDCILGLDLHLNWCPTTAALPTLHKEPSVPERISKRFPARRLDELRVGIVRKRSAKIDHQSVPEKTFDAVLKKAIRDIDNATSTAIQMCKASNNEESPPETEDLYDFRNM